MKIKIFVTNNAGTDVIDNCESIARENHIANGGTLRYLGLCEDADYLVCIKIKHKIVGYAALKENFLSGLLNKKDLYIYQIAIRKKFQGKGFGTKLLNFVIKHSKGYEVVTSNVNPENTASIKLHEKIGMKNYGTCDFGITFIKPVDNIENNSSLDEFLEDRAKKEICLPENEDEIEL